MDGQFVPNISVGFPVLEAVRRETTLPIDVHLMIAQPERYIEQFAQAGADFISVHVEATPHIHRALELIKLQNIKAGVVINPGTPVELIKPVLSIVDYVLVMTVNPGFGGQQFIQSCVAKVQQLAELKAINSMILILKSMVALMIKQLNCVLKLVHQCLSLVLTF